MDHNEGSSHEEQDVLSKLNHEFKKAKVEQILRFLEDQEELNTRFHQYKLHDDETEEDGQDGEEVNINKKESYSKQLQAINRQATPASQTRSSSAAVVEDNQNYDNLEKYRSTSRKSLGQSCESLTSIDSNFGTDSPISSANCRRRRYRLSSHASLSQPTPAAEIVNVSNVNRSTEPSLADNVEKKTLIRKLIRPKSAYGSRKPVSQSLTENTSPECQEEHTKKQPTSIMSSRVPPEGAETNSNVDSFAQSFRNPFMFANSYRPPSRSWDVVSDSVNIVKQSESAAYPVDYANKPSPIGKYMIRKPPKPAFGYTCNSLSIHRQHVSKLATDGIEGVMFQDIHKTSSSNDSTEGFDRDEFMSRGLESRETTLGRFLTSQEGPKPPTEPNLHRIIRWAPTRLNIRHNQIRRYMSYEGDRIGSYPQDDEHTAMTTGIRKAKVIPDLKTIRSKARPIVLKLPPLESSNLKQTVTGNASDIVTIVGTSTRTTTMAEPTVSGY